jgi:hypothetical protein
MHKYTVHAQSKYKHESIPGIRKPTAAATTWARLCSELESEQEATRWPNHHVGVLTNSIASGRNLIAPGLDGSSILHATVLGLMQPVEKLCEFPPTRCRNFLMPERAAIKASVSILNTKS